jgi:ribosomal-protein-alanine N-acetyltransferase
VAAWFIAGEGEIGNVAVDPEMRGRGVGSVLLESALLEGRRRRATQIFLEVRESNHVAREMYASHGFVSVGRRRHYYRRPVEDALVLRLTL